jgi:hypothetical protein
MITKFILIALTVLHRNQSINLKAITEVDMLLPRTELYKESIEVSNAIDLN